MTAREKQWRSALKALGYAVTDIYSSGSGDLWISAKDNDPSAFCRYLKVVDAWDEANDAWSYGFELREHNEPGAADVSYDGERVDIDWLCSMIDARR